MTKRVKPVSSNVSSNLLMFAWAVGLPRLKEHQSVLGKR